MKRYAASLGAVFFVCGVVIVPALHQAGLCFPHSGCERAAESHNEQGHQSNDSCPTQDGHSDGACPICHLAATPTIVSCVAVQPVTCYMAEQFITPTHVSFSARLESLSFLARGPPLFSSCWCRDDHRGTDDFRVAKHFKDVWVGSMPRHCVTGNVLNKGGIYKCDETYW